MKNKFEVKSIKILRSASEETLCYTANIYINGKKIGGVINHGMGGPTDLRHEIGSDGKRKTDFPIKGLADKYREIHHKESEKKYAEEPWRKGLYDNLTDEQAITDMADKMAYQADALKDVKKLHAKHTAMLKGSMKVTQKKSAANEEAFRDSVLREYGDDVLFFCFDMSLPELFEEETGDLYIESIEY